MAAGGLYLIVDTEAFESSEAGRQADVGVGDDGSALLGLGGVDPNKVYQDSHEINLTNRVEDTLEVTLESQNGQFSFTGPQGGSSGKVTVTLAPGASDSVSVSADGTGTVSETISFEAVSPTGPQSIELARKIAIKRAGRNPIDVCSNIREYPKGNGNTVKGKISRPNGSARLSQGATAKKQIDAGDCVILRSNSTAKGKLLADTNAILRSNARVEAQVGTDDSPIGGSLTLEKQTQIDGKAIITGDVTTGNDATLKEKLRATNGSVELGPGTRVEGQVGSSDTPIGGDLTLGSTSGGTGNPTQIDGKATVTGDITTGNDAVVKGELRAINGSVELGPGTRVEGQVGSDDTPIGGDLTLGSTSEGTGNRTQIDGKATVTGDITTGNDAVVKGELRAINGSVELGSGTTIEGQVGSSDTPVGGDLTLKSRSVIQGDVYVEGEVDNAGTIEGEINPS